MAGIVNHYQQKNMRANKYCDLLARRVRENIDIENIKPLAEKTRYWLMAVSKTRAQRGIIEMVTEEEMVLWFKGHANTGTGIQIANKLSACYESKYGQHPA